MKKREKKKKEEEDLRIICEQGCYGDFGFNTDITQQKLTYNEKGKYKGRV